MKQSTSLTVMYLILAILSFFFVGILHVNYLLPEIGVLLSLQTESSQIMQCIEPFLKFFVYWAGIYVFEFIGGTLLSLSWPQINSLIKSVLFERVKKISLEDMKKKIDFSFYIEEYASSLGQILFVFLTQLMPSLVIVISIIFKNLKKNWKIGMFSIAWFIIISLISLISSMKLVGVKKELADIKNKQKDTIQDFLKNIELDRMFKVNFPLPNEEKEHELQSKNLFYFGIGPMIFGVFSIILFFIYIILINPLKMQIFKQYGWRFCWESFRIMNTLPIFLDSLARCKKAREVFSFEIENFFEDKEKVERIESLSINSTNFEIGKTTQISGNCSSGKTRTLKALSGIILSNDIRINGMTINSINRKSLIGNFSIVPQENYFFNASVTENITLFNPLDKTKLEEAYKKSGLSECKTDLEKICGKNGENLSGGEKTCLKIARMLYNDKHSNVLLLDEPLAGLDKSLRELILKVIDEYKNKNRTILLIEHSHTFGNGIIVSSFGK